MATTKNAGKAPVPEDAPSADSAASRRARRMVAEIVQQHLGVKARTVVRRGGGLTNEVFEVAIPGRKLIIRTHVDATRIKDYLKEQWAMHAARAAGLPVPNVLEVGNLQDGRPYVIAEHVEGSDGRRAPNRLALLETLGRLTRRLHGVRTHGYGPVFDWSGNRLSRHSSWTDWLANGFGVEERLAVLLRHRMIDRRRAMQFRRVAATMSAWRKPPVLQHGDLRLKNTIVDEKGELVALLDWDNAISLPAPYWDLSLALHDLGIDEKEAFLSGYGMKRAAWQAVLPVVRLFNTLNYSHAVESAARSKKADRLAWFRARLSAELDLYER